MRALTWQGNEHVEVTDMLNPTIQEPNDIIIRVMSTAIPRRTSYARAYGCGW
jgi:S-(hydroxymethyl)glutathione dehydrogenase/alcohol dehydrogenase